MIKCPNKSCKVLSLIKMSKKGLIDLIGGWGIITKIKVKD